MLPAHVIHKVTIRSMLYTNNMQIERTFDTRTGEDIFLITDNGKTRTLKSQLDKVNTVLSDTPIRHQRIRAMELAIGLEKQAHQDTQERLEALQEELGILNKNYQIAINTILALNEGASPSVVNKLIGQLQKRKLVIDG